MKKNELFFPSADKMTNIHMVMWEPDDEVLGVVNIVHGVTEHIMRYEEMAYFFTNRGIAVVGIDLLLLGIFKYGGFVLGNDPVMYTHRGGTSLYVKSIQLPGELNIAE